MIAVDVRRLDDQLSVHIRDNGPGLPPRPTTPSPSRGTGIALIEGLARQIGARPEWSSDGGTALRLEVRR